MPGLDQTGPAGSGPGTGRGMGSCGRGTAYGRGSGQGIGLGRGRGFCRANYVEPESLSTEAKKQLLEAELKRIDAEKAEIQKRLTSLE